MEKTNRKKKVKMDEKNAKPSMPHLPEEIMFEIHSRLPPISLLKFRCVSKLWSVLFNNPKLIKMLEINYSIMLRRGNDIYSIDNDSVSSSSLLLLDGIEKIHCPIAVEAIVGCCNGLFCIRTSAVLNVFSLWNPSTGECKEIPSPPYQFQVDNSMYQLTCVIGHGFGYDSKSDDYKFVRIVIYTPKKLNYYKDDEYVAQIYSLRSNSWKQIQHISYAVLYSSAYRSQGYGVFCNGALHWQSNSLKPLIALHMTAESVREISLPEKLDVNFRTHIDVLDGFLCMLYCNLSLGFEVWLMKDYGKKESWTKLYSISKLTPLEVKWFNSLRRIKCLKTGEILLEVGYTNMTNKFVIEALVLYDPKNETSKVLKLDENIASLNSPSMFHTYVKSSVSVISN